eukprot:CAMPEP_0176035348 /NCGR_PEP_ID=MMETSP0120_2-20121206/17482_1 /TAXON_ID=160619 /ORGANISM="Kryptoperidinium foliaceum, Strain CCMP 1326" /LENGTH=255 /DNA_ID=CAMNT_0017368697 /DNA_START=348 /DNA_END=1115 /DNA_ORIENTATION=-
MRRLWLSFNQFHGTLPASYAEFLPNLELLHLGDNQFTGTLPNEWGNLTNMAGMGVQRNNLQGSLPSSFSQMTYLHWLWLYSNQFTGTLPSQWGGKMPDLQLFFCNNNEISGTLPSEWGEMTRMERFFLDNNNINGRLPSSYGQMRGLKQIWLNSNRFTGSLPNDWGNMTSLYDIDISYNTLTGSIPQSYANWRAPNPRGTGFRAVFSNNCLTVSNPEYFCNAWDSLQVPCSEVFSDQNQCRLDDNELPLAAQALP